jgi:hypothetical protein
MAVGIPTSTSHGSAMDSLVTEFNAILVNGERKARESRIAMASGPVSDLLIREVWEHFAYAEFRIEEIRRTSDFHDEYARHRGLSFFFNCTDDVNAATDKIINLPDNHKFKQDHRVDFKLIQGALTGGLSEGVNYFLRTIDSPNGTVTITTTEGGASDINLSNATGTAEMILNIKPDLSPLRTAIGAALTEIETNLTQRATTYDRENLEHTFSTRTAVETATLRTKLSDIEALIDVVAA